MFKNIFLKIYFSSILNSYKCNNCNMNQVTNKLDNPYGFKTNKKHESCSKDNLGKPVILDK